MCVNNPDDTRVGNIHIGCIAPILKTLLSLTEPSVYSRANLYEFTTTLKQLTRYLPPCHMSKDRNHTYALEQIIISYMPLQVSMTYYPHTLLDFQFFMLPYISQVNIP